MITTDISQIVTPYRQFLIGFSGGLDSTVLLYRFKLWRDLEPDISLRAIHVHHGLHSDANYWVKHCSEICSKWRIPLLVIYLSLIKEKKNNIESQARKLRYMAFKEALLPGEVLVTAHHLDDQCETFLLALKRGSGPAGLSAMATRRSFSTTQLLRPLLNETRKSLMNWAKMHSLYWIEDKSNHDDRCDRNFLRLRIIPLLSKRWLHISSAIARSATLCSEQENLLSELLADEFNTLISKDSALKIAPLTSMSTSRRTVLLRYWFSKQGALMPSYSMLNRIWKEVALARKDATPHIHLDGYNICRFKGLLWRIKSEPFSFNNDMKFTWHNLHKPLILPCGMGRILLKDGGNISLPSNSLERIVNIRFKTTGNIHIVGRHRGRKLKKIWQELNIPPWERTKIPLIFYGDTLIAAVGRFITREGWVSNGVTFNQEF